MTQEGKTPSGDVNIQGQEGREPLDSSELLLTAVRIDKVDALMPPLVRGWEIGALHDLRSEAYKTNYSVRMEGPADAVYREAALDQLDEFKDYLLSSNIRRRERGMSHPIKLLQSRARI